MPLMMAASNGESRSRAAARRLASCSSFGNALGFRRRFFVTAACRARISGADMCVRIPAAALLPVTVIGLTILFW